MAADFDPQLVANAKVGLASLGGAFIYHTIRPAATLAKAATNGISSVLCGLLFTHPAMTWLSLNESYAGGMGAVLGMCGLGIASGLIRAVEKFDFSAFLPKGKSR